MAAVKHVKLVVDLSTQGIAQAKKELDRLAGSMETVKTKTKAVSKGAGELYRNTRGVSEATGRANKDFGRMSQGMGGLVAAYATIAANVFALSAAFLVLKRTADLSSMVKSAENFSDRFGVGVTRITKRMQEASGGALDFAEALPTINKAISSGIGIEKLEQLTVAATKAAQTFGGSTAEALSRFISASQRGRVEIIQTLGVVIKTEQAYKDYAISIGKTAGELTAFDRQQAILNATISESQKVFEGIKIDPNPFQQLLVTITDLKDVIGTTVTDKLTPMIEAFNQSKTAALALMATIALMVGRKIFPELSAGITGLAKAGKDSSRNAREALANAKRREAKADESAAHTSTNTSLKAIKKRDQAFTESLKDRLTKTSIFHKKVIDEENKVNVAILNSKRALIAKEIKLREAGIMKGRQKALMGTSLSQLKKEYTSLNQVGLSADKVNISIKNIGLSATQTSNFIVKGFNVAAKSVTSMTHSVIRLSSVIKSGFAQGFQISEGKVAKSIKSMHVAWLIFMRDIAVGTAKSGSHITNFAKVVSRAAGIIGGALSVAVSFLFSLTIYISLAMLAWELFGDRITGVTKREKELKTSLEDSVEAFKEITKRTDKFIGSLDNANKSSQRFVRGMEFLRGTLDSTITAARDIDAALKKAFGTSSLDDLLDQITVAEKRIKMLEDARHLIAKTPQFSDASSATNRYIDTSKDFRQSQALTKESALTKAEVQLIEKTMKIIAEELTPSIVDNFHSLNNLLKDQGLAGLDVEVVRQLSGEFSTLADGGASLIAIFKTQSGEAFSKALLEQVKDTESFARAMDIVRNSMSGMGDTYGKVMEQISATKTLQDTSTNIDNFVQGIDKLKNASVPNKEIINFLLNSTRALETLSETSGGLQLGNFEHINQDILKGGDLEALKNLLSLKDNDSINDLFKKSKNLLQLFKNVITSTTVEQNKLKINTIKLTSLKEEEATVDARRFDIIKETNIIALDNAKSQLQITRNNITSHELELAAIKEVGSEREIEIRQLLIIQDVEEKARIEKIKVLEQNKDRERAILKTIVDSLSAMISTNKTLSETETLVKSISISRAEDLASRLIIFKLENSSLKLEKEKIHTQIREFEFNQKTAEQDLLTLVNLEAQLDLLRQKEQIQEREVLNNTALGLAEAGEQFTPQGMQVLGQLFVRELRDGVRDMGSSLQTLAKGFGEALNTTVDSAVDKLLEGHGFDNFAYALTEAIKEGLRNAIGEGIKNQIKMLLSDIFPEKESPAAAAAKERHQAMMDRIQEHIAEIRKNTIILEHLNSTLNTKRSGIGGQSLAEKPVGNTLGAIASIAKISDQNPITTILSQISAKATVATDVAVTAKEEAKNGLSGLIGIMAPIFSAIMSSGAGEAIGSIAKSFFAKGGITQGMQIPRMAGGGMGPGITTGPQLAILGEGKNREAVVPLPNNREIPVQLSGGSGDTITIEQNFDFSNADASSISELRAASKLIEDRTFNRVFNEINKGGKYAKMSGRR